jgi:tetratricopeptide (TPR) repeat protein
MITSSDIRRFLDEDKCLSGVIRRAVGDACQRYNLEPIQTMTWIAQNLVTSKGTLASVTERPGDEKSIPDHVLRVLEDYYLLRSDVRFGSHWRELHSARLINPLRLAAVSIGADSNTAVETTSVADLISNAASAFSDGDWDIADRQANEALRLLSTDDLRQLAKVDTLLGNIAYQRGDSGKSRELYLKSAELYESIQDYAAVGHLLAAIGQLQMIDQEATAAVATLQSAVDRLPADGAVKIELARAFAKSGEPHAAIAVLRSVLTTSAEAGGGDARILRGEILSDLGDSAGALRDLEHVSSTPLPSVHAARALTLARLGRFSDAERGIKQALELGRESGPVLLRAAQIRALRGDAPAAMDLVREALTASEPGLSEYLRRQANDLREECDA